ncbi:Uncharacterised protein [BD1-7 clade bacterium]|uniref:Uncharacterized protein n=1 Tax=BD1-7 clade bacterium TaxID=2029982 RepID=A0A5S9PJK7_9GAMM|nr:Uncharacterised protein [BD1-7 clade bacterium]
MKNVFMRLRVQSEGVRFRAIVNGNEIERAPKGEECRSERPVNPYLVSGKNTMEIDFYPWSKAKSKLFKNEDAYVCVDLIAYDEGGLLGPDGCVVSSLRYGQSVVAGGLNIAGSKASGVYTFSDIEGNNSDAFDGAKYELGDVYINDGLPISNAGNIYRDVSFATEFPAWKYLSSETMPQIADMSDDEYYQVLIPSLFKEYQKIHDALGVKDLDSIMPLFNERNSEMDSAFYHEAGTYEGKLRASLESQFDTGMILADIDQKYVEAIVSDNGKLAKLDEPYLIYFHDEEKSIFTGYDIWFRREDDKWIISR